MQNQSLPAHFSGRTQLRGWTLPVTWIWIAIQIFFVTERPTGENLEMKWNQWEFQDPKMEVPTIYKAYIRYSTSILGSWNSH